MPKFQDCENSVTTGSSMFDLNIYLLINKSTLDYFQIDASQHGLHSTTWMKIPTQKDHSHGKDATRFQCFELSSICHWYTIIGLKRQWRRSKAFGLFGVFLFFGGFFLQKLPPGGQS